MTMNRMSAMAAGFLLAAAGCGVEGTETSGPIPTDSARTAAATFDPPSLSAEDDRAMNLLASVEVTNQAVVKFYEPQPGVIFISAAGRNETPRPISVDMKRLSAAGIYERLSNQKAPAVLVDATARASQLQRLARPTREAAPADVAPTTLRASTGIATRVAGDVLKVTSALTFANSYDQWFYDNFCENGSQVGDFTWGNTWMFVSGSGNFTRSDNNWVNSTVSVYGGGSVHNKVQIRPWYSWETPKDLFIQNGYYYEYTRINYSTDFDFRVYVDQADGDSYHWCAYGSN